LIHNKEKFDYIVIETTGMADPTFAQTFFVEEELKENLYLDGIVSMVDSKNAINQLERIPSKSAHQVLQIINESIEQICFADRIVLNKTDLVSEEEIEKLKERVKKINPFAQIFTTSFSKLDPELILGIRSFDLERVLKFDPQFLEFRPQRQHDPSIMSHCLIWRREIELERLKKWISKLLSENSQNIFRSKALFNIKNSKHKYVMQGVHSSFEISENNEWMDEEKHKKMSKLILIGKDLKIEKVLESFNLEFENKIPIKTEEELMRPPPSFFGMFLLILLVGMLLYPNDLVNLLNFPFISTVLIILGTLYYFQSKRNPWNELL